MKKTFVIAAALMLAACSEKEKLVEERVPVSLAYTTVQATETRAAQNLNEGTFVPGETINVRISNTGINSWADYTFTTGNDGAMTPTSTIPYYPSGSQNIDIAACYPASAGTTFSVATDQTSDASYKASDLMFASVTNQAKQAETVTLEFVHKMAKINLNITAGSGITSITSVSLLNVKPTVSFDLATGEVGAASGTATSIAVSNNGAALIPAQTLDGDLLDIVTDKGTATYRVNDKTLEAGLQYTINITVSNRSIGTTNLITGWQDGGELTVYAEKPNIAGHEYVDMGEVTIGNQTKHLLWATCNVGAVDPWDTGDYFQWGVTIPYYQAGYSRAGTQNTQWIDGKNGYNWANYPFMEAGYEDANHLTKYNATDNKTTFSDYNYVDDAARQRWGSTWRTPTAEELAALQNTDVFSRTWTNDYLGTGIMGCIVTRLNGPCGGNSIFLPVTGRRMYGYYNDEAHGFYWSSSLKSEWLNAWCLQLGNDNVNGFHLCNYDYTRYIGYTIRPVSDFAE